MLDGDNPNLASSCQPSFKYHAKVLLTVTEIYLRGFICGCCEFDLTALTLPFHLCSSLVSTASRISRMKLRSNQCIEFQYVSLTFDDLGSSTSYNKFSSSHALY